MVIDWTKPIQWRDGTPARLISTEPDYEGDYLVETYSGHASIWVRSDGKPTGWIDGELYIENVPAMTLKDAIEQRKQEKIAELQDCETKEAMEQIEGYATW